VVLAFENNAGSFEHETRAAVGLECVADAGGFHHSALRRKLAIKDRQTSVLRVRGSLRPNAVLGIEHESRIVGHQAAGLHVLERRWPRLKIGLADLPATQSAGPDQAAHVLFAAFAIFPKYDYRGALEA